MTAIKNLLEMALFIDRGIESDVLGKYVSFNNNYSYPFKLLIN